MTYCSLCCINVTELGCTVCCINVAELVYDLCCINMILCPTDTSHCVYRINCQPAKIRCYKTKLSAPLRKDTSFFSSSQRPDQLWGPASLSSYWVLEAKMIGPWRSPELYTHSPLCHHALPLLLKPNPSDETYKRPLTTETLVRSQAIACVIAVEQVTLGQACRQYFACPLTVSFHHCSTLTHSPITHVMQTQHLLQYLNSRISKQSCQVQFCAFPSSSVILILFVRT